MGGVGVYNSVTLDGVMQAPGAPEEDLRGGFEHGGWAQPYADSVFQTMGSRISLGGPLLLGRWTYEKFASIWPHMPEDNPFTKAINACRKYVASTTLREPLSWNNSTLLEGDAADAVANLKEELDEDLVILGSGELIRSLMASRLIDEYVLLIHPLVLGSGRRLFPEGIPFAALRLVDTVTTTTGVVIGTYRPAESAA